MNSSETHSQRDRKAFEISYAVLRLAGTIPQKVFADHLRDAGLHLLAGTASGDHAKTHQSLRSLEYLARLAVEFDFISIANAKILIAQLQGLKELVDREASAQQLDMGEVFSKLQLETAPLNSLPDVKLESVPQTASHSAKSFKLQTELPGEQRQASILAKIRESGNCRFKQLQEFLPDVSERTIRYDIQKLADDGLIERIGGGGPFSYYRAKPLPIPGLPEAVAKE